MLFQYCTYVKVIAIDVLSILLSILYIHYGELPGLKVDVPLYESSFSCACLRHFCQYHTVSDATVLKTVAS